MYYFELLKRFEGGESVPTLHPLNDMEIDDKDLTELIV